MFRAHKGATPYVSPFAAHVAAIKVTVMSAHSTVTLAKQQAVAKPAKVTAIRKPKKYKPAKPRNLPGIS